jgi:hypothetical protein
MRINLTRVRRLFLVLAGVAVFAVLTIAPTEAKAIAKPTKTKPTETKPKTKPKTEPRPAPVKILAEVRHSGADCGRRFCEDVLTLRSDGVVTLTENGTRKRAPFKLDLQETKRLTKLIESTNIKPDSLPKFTGTCPNEFDAPETIYTVRSQYGTRVYRGCTVVIPEAGVFLELDELWNIAVDE